MRTNYVIASWSGPRRHDNRLDHLKLHLRNLKMVRHNLDQITVVSPINPSEPQSYRSLLDSLKKPIVVLQRPNIGLSYGSWSHAFDTYGEKFDYYFFMEDDYHYTLHNFDKTMIEIYEEKDCGYLCWLYERGHAAVSCGLASSKALSKVKNHFGDLPHSTNPSNVYASQGGQIEFSKAFEKVGMKVSHTADRFKVPFRASGGVIKELRRENQEELFIPSDTLRLRFTPKSI